MKAWERVNDALKSLVACLTGKFSSEAPLRRPGSGNPTSETPSPDSCHDTAFILAGIRSLNDCCFAVVPDIYN